MAPQPSMISGLSQQTDDCSLLVRVTRIWESINKRTNQVMFTNLVLLDEEGSHILATVRNNQKQLFMPLLAEGKVYSISSVKVVPGPPNYRTVSRDIALNFYYKTTITKVEDTGVVYQFKFELKNFTEVPAYVADVKNFIDVIGLVRTYGQLETRSNGAKKLDFVLSNGSEKIVVALWKSKATQFLKLLAQTKDDVVFAVITGLMAKKFSGTVLLSSSDATKTYFNINYAPLSDLKSSLSDAHGKDASQIPKPVAVRFVSVEDKTISDSNIKEILETSLPNGSSVLRRTCEAKVVAVLDGDGWFYNCCPRCARKVSKLDMGYYCTHCNKDANDFKPRYRIIVRVEDDSAHTSFALFNKEAEQLIGIPVDRLIADLPEGTEFGAIPPAVKNIIGKKCAFEIKISSYNTQRGYEEYTVYRLSECTDGVGDTPAGTTNGRPAKRARNDSQ